MMGSFFIKWENMSNGVITHNDVLGVLKRSVCIFCLWQNLNNCVIMTGE